MKVTSTLKEFKVAHMSQGKLSVEIQTEMLSAGAGQSVLDKQGTINFLFFEPAKETNHCLIEILTYTIIGLQYFKMQTQSLYKIDGLLFLLGDRMTNDASVNVLTKSCSASLRKHRDKFKKAEKDKIFGNYEIPEKSDEELTAMVLTQLKSQFN